MNTDAGTPSPQESESAPAQSPTPRNPAAKMQSKSYKIIKNINLGS